LIIEDGSQSSQKVPRRIIQGTQPEDLIHSIKGIPADTMEETRIIQEAMLPVGPLRTPWIEVTRKYRPASEVGGDFLDYFFINDRFLGLYLGDVSGKGLPAALYAALTVGILRGINKTGATPSSVLELLNRRLTDRHMPERFCVVQYAVLDLASHELCLANAGLPLPLHLSSAGCRPLGDGGFPCGIFPGVQYGVHTLRLNAGECVLFSTDGLADAQNSAGEKFGIERLVQTCSENKNPSGGILLDHLFDAVDGFAAGVHQYDDMTAAVLTLS
jgi:sigma-B regulation protein RsbU (phosphoserine phosphatase)